MGKKTRQNAIRVTSDLFDLGRTMMSSRGAENFSDYVRGLILLDAAHQSAGLLAGHDLPAWITRDKRFERYVFTREEIAAEHEPASR